MQQREEDMKVLAVTIRQDLILKTVAWTSTTPLCKGLTWGLMDMGFDALEGLK